ALQSFFSWTGRDLTCPHSQGNLKLDSGGGSMPRAILSRALLLGLLLPQSVMAWEARIGAGTSSGNHPIPRDGLHFLLGIQNRLGPTPMFLRGELMGNRFYKGRPAEVPSYSIDQAGVYHIETYWEYRYKDPSLMVGPALMFDARPEGPWSPYLIAGFGYYRH